MKRASLIDILSVSATMLLLGVLAFPTTAQAAPPVLTVPGSQTVNETQQLQFNVSAIDPDGQIVTLTVSNRPSGSTFADHHNNTGTFTWTPGVGQTGSYSPTFKADDGFGGIDTKSVSIQVVHTNTAPVLDPIGDKTVERGSNLYATLMGSDADNDPLSYRVTGMPPYGSLTDLGDGTGYILFAPTAGTPTGPSTMTVYLSDGQVETSETFTVTVVAAAGSNPPVLDPIGNQTVAEAATSLVALSASDPDGDAMSWSVGLPGFANLVVTGSSAGSTTARLELRPGYCDAGSYPASILVTDGAFTDSENITIVVTDVNRAPAWQPPQGGYAMTLDAGTSASLDVAASDPDAACDGAQPALTIAGTSDDNALTASLNDRGNGGGTLQVSAAAGASGSYTVTLRATDASNAHADATVAVTVNAVVVSVSGRAWSDSDPIRLKTGKPRERFYLEPIDHSFALDAVDLTSIRMTAWPGAGTMGSIAPLAGSFLLGLDRDQNGVTEIRMEFSKDDLRALLGNLNDPSQSPLTITANLTGGGTVTALINSSILPDDRALRRVGPNPMNPEAIVTVHLVVAGRARVAVYDLNGRLVRTLMDESSAAAGDHAVHFEGKDDQGRHLASGRYFVKAETASGVDSAPITILK